MLSNIWWVISDISLCFINTKRKKVDASSAVIIVCNNLLTAGLDSDRIEETKCYLVPLGKGEYSFLPF
jgi:hypothetical protein